MANFICNYSECNKEFYSKHSKAKFCSRSCSAKVTLNSKGVPQKYSNEQLIKILQDEADKFGFTPSSRMFENNKNLPDPYTYRSRFGSWNRAVIAAGLNPRQALPPNTIQNRRGRGTKYNEDARLVTVKQRFEILTRDKFRCAYCGGSPEQGYTLNVDHRIPFSKGGKTVPENLITACTTCDLGKSDNIVEFN